MAHSYYLLVNFRVEPASSFHSGCSAPFRFRRKPSQLCRVLKACTDSPRSLGEGVQTAILQAPMAQTFLNPLVKEYTLNHIRDPIRIYSTRLRRQVSAESDACFGSGPQGAPEDDSGSALSRVLSGCIRKGVSRVPYGLSCVL